MNTKHDYTGKTIYVGIDVHKKTYACASICEGEVIKRDSMPADPERLVKYLNNTFRGAEIKTAYEAGFSGFHLHRYLTSHGIESNVVHPGAIEVASRNRVKTDKRDALKIVKQFSDGRIKGIHIPSEAEEYQRSVTRLRTNILRLRTQVANKLKSLLFTQGLITKDDDKKVSRHWIDEKLTEIKSKVISNDFYYVANQYAEEWIQLTDRIKGINQQLALQAKADAGLQMIYESVPGIGLIHARELINELGDMKQFKNEKQLFSFTGLTPSECSSGEHTRHGHITRQGRAVFRKILVEAAWVAIKKDANLQEIYQRLSQHRGKKRAIVGIARRLIGRIRSCISKGSLYDVNHKNVVVQEPICATSSLF